MNASVNAAAQPAGQTSPDRNRSTSGVSLSICLHRYLRWLRQLHGTIDAISDDAYTLDRLLCQGVLPLRQRTSVTPTAAEAQLRAAVCKLLIGDIAAQSARPEGRIWKTSTNTRSGYSAATFSSAVFPPLIGHTESPSCPCRAYFEQRQREEESRRLSLSQRSSQDKDSDTESHTGHAATISSSSGNDNENKESAVHLSAVMSNFAAKLKHASCDADNMRISSGLASTLLAHTVTLGCIGSNSSSRGDVTASERKARLVSRQSDAPSQTVPLLPVAVATPSPASSAELGSDAPQANSNGDTQCCQRDGHEGNKSSASSIFRPLPIPVDTATQAHRTLHPMLAHIKPEDVRRCSLCSAQVLLESVWHTLYQMNLLTLLSAAPSMAAPLPLPPPDILRIRPVEALLLLYQCAQRCFVSGIIMATSVGVPASSIRGGPFSSQGDVSVQPLSALDVLRGGYGGGPAATTGLSEQQQRHATEEGVLAGLAGGLLCVVDSVISTAVPHLWPHATIDAPAKQAVEDIMGDALRLRFELFHTIFVILTSQKGSHAAPAQLATVCGELLSCVRRLPFWHQKDLVSPESSLRSFSLAQRSDGATHFSEGDGQGMISNKESVGEATDAVTAEKVRSSTSVDTNPFGAAHEALIQAFALLDVPHTTASGTGDAIDGKEMAVLKDDMSVLCCVAALLVSFGRLVHTCDTLASESDDRLLSASEPALPSLSSRLSSSSLLSLHHHSLLLDCHVYPCLQRLQNSIRGDCSVQARHLIALWWLLRAETVRQWVWMETRGLSHLQGCRTFNKEAELHILGVTITLYEDLEREVHPAQEQPHQHWSQWLQDASRAAVRASDVANEFLGLTLIQTWSSASSPLVKKSLSSVASSASMPPPLRWQLPVPSASFLSLQTPVAFLSLPWIRLWLLLCPPLFRISPADVVALRQNVQRQPRHNEEGSPTAFAVTGKTKKGAAVATDKRKLSQVQQASPRNTHQVGTCAQSKAIQRTTGTPTVLGVSDPSIGSRNRTESVTGATTAPSDNQNKRAKLERRLQLSKAPVCFWIRWFLLFTPSSPVKPESNDSDASRKSSSTLLLSALEYVATDLHGPMTACIEGSPNRATPPTELICLLQQAFPLYTPANLLTALRAQTQLFLARGADLQQGVATEPQAVAEPLAMHETFEGVTFAPHSFAAALAALQAVVKHSWVEAPACIPSHEHDVSRAEISESPSEADPPSSKSKRLVPSPPSVMNRGRTIDSAVPVDAVTQTAGRSGTRRSPLVATRVLSRRVVGTGAKSSATGTEKGEGNW
ncbi:hypothetical protein, conserved [Leishmania tarentolae]|uniref:Uncharacterized protein n=1 Tax=Leishmania tarentolae TaxID=5689 RepID=A0A640KTJ8_LEITA|nr:hypothetical protein, conserved [Leishmania tarentolae]